MKNRALTWPYLKALNQLYVSGRTEAKIMTNGYIANVVMKQKKLIKYKSGNIKILEAASAFSTFYEQNFKTDYQLYENFLFEQELESDARRRYTEQDIKTLMFIAEQKDILIKNLSSIKTFSNIVFDGYGSKYLENKPGLKDAVCKILGIDDFPEKDPKNLQWRFIVDCINPKIIVLCENLGHLKNAWKARENRVELWYVGGNNIAMLDHIEPEKLSLPIYYSCDWDFHGLSIFSRIKEKLRSKPCLIKILHPYTLDKALPIDSPHHKSKWNFNKTLSGLKEIDFTDNDIITIKHLIKHDIWIEEESIDLIKMLFDNDAFD